jgi:hypothetical protein
MQSISRTILKRIPLYLLWQAAEEAGAKISFESMRLCISYLYPKKRQAFPVCSLSFGIYKE